MLAVDVAQGIVERELLWGYRIGAGPAERLRVKAGPADTSIHTIENGMSIARDMAKPIRIEAVVHRGISWTRADKRPGSRKSGWEMVRRMMRDAHPREDGTPREAPGLYVVGEHCDQFLRTVPSLARLERDPDDIDTDAEDHIADEVRYRVRSARASSGKVNTLY